MPQKKTLRGGILKGTGNREQGTGNMPCSPSDPGTSSGTTPGKPIAGDYSIVGPSFCSGYAAQGEIALWPSTNGAIVHFLVLPGSLSSITEITGTDVLVH